MLITGTAIPQIKGIEGWKDLPIQESAEALVPVGPFSNHNMLFTDSIYWGERTSSPYEQGELKGALLTMFLRQGVADRLAKVSESLPRGHALLVWDAYRPLAVQHALFRDYRDQLMVKKGMSEAEANEAATEFVTEPSSVPTRPSAHYTGASVDLTIVKFDDDVLDELDKLNEQLQSDNWKVVYEAEMRRLQLLRNHATPLNMGAGFDEVCAEEEIGGTQTNRTHTRYFELKEQAGLLTPDEIEIRDNRRMLFHAMAQQGFSNYWTEVWHFDFGNQFHGVRTGEPVIYGAATFSPANQEHELMRVKHYNGSEYWRLSGTHVVDRFGQAHKFSDADIIDTVRASAGETGPLRETRHAKAMRLVAA